MEGEAPGTMSLLPTATDNVNMNDNMRVTRRIMPRSPSGHDPSPAAPDRRPGRHDARRGAVYEAIQRLLDRGIDPGDRRITRLLGQLRSSQRPILLGETFGTHLRRVRLGLGLSLRKVASDLGVSPPYLSRVEVGLNPPPSEERVRALARLLDQDADELLAAAGRVSSDVTDKIRARPKAMSDLVRFAGMLSSSALSEVVAYIRRKGNRR